ncbi:MAG: T9SS type A sorting domain-containing protein [Chitinophagaceae bacterium]|nr:T9SS type A sorting domain-containing protein [Chitinophagaceae bacterium]
MKKYLLLFLTCTIISFFAQAQLSGNSLQLKANANYVSVADASSASLSNTMTWEFWIYFRCENGIVGTTPISKGWCGTSWSYYIAIENQKLGFWKTNPTGTGTCPNGAHVQYESDSSVVPYNTWTHIAIVQSGSTIQFFVNGLPVSNSIISGSAFTGIKSSGRPVLLGAYQSLGGSYVSVPKSNLDDIRIWNTARTQAEIQSQMNTELIGNESGLFAYWKLNESDSGAGISVVNSALATGATFNGTTVGTVTNLEFNDNSTITNKLPNCDPKLWLKADEGAYTNNGTTLATDGQTIQQWNDQSNNGFNASQTDASKRPTWQQNAFNGKPALWFDGVNGNYWLENTLNSPVATAGSARTYFVVAKAACNASGTYYPGGHLFSNRRTPNASTLEFVKNGSNGIFHGGNLCCNHPQVTNVNFEEGQTKPFIGSWRTGGTGTNLDFWFNGISTTTTNANFVIDNGSAGYVIGDRRDGFQFDVPTGRYDWQGHIAEIIVYDRALTDIEMLNVEEYLQNKYLTTFLPAQFTNVQSTTTLSNTSLSDATWKHLYNSTDNSKVIVSINDNCLDLGTINSSVYIDGTSSLNGGQYTMRRHFVINPTLDPVGIKRVRLYYTNADFANLQSTVPSLTTHAQLAVTKYDGPNEDGIFNATGGTVTFIPPSQITTGSVFGVNYLEFDVTGFSEFWIHKNNNAPLPATLLSFTAQKQNNLALINWKVSDAINVSHFEVEKSYDAISFFKIKDVPFVNEDEYKCTDILNNKPKHYYRLRIVDIDGKIAYSEVKQIINTEKVQVTIYPNPANDIVYIDVTNEIYNYDLKDISGKSVLKGTNKDVLNIENIPNGLYFLYVKTDKDIQVIKVVKSKK